MILIVPDYVREAIDREIYRFCEKYGAISDDEREKLYDAFLEYFHEHGQVPELKVN